MIVFDQEQHRDLVDRGDIERLVELARAGAAVADDRQAEDLLAVAPCRPGSAHDHAQHLAQVADHGKPPRGRVAMMDIALAGHASGCRHWPGIGKGVDRESAPSSRWATRSRCSSESTSRPGRSGIDMPIVGGLVAGADGDGAL